jgi:hypothetical protein
MREGAGPAGQVDDHGNHELGFDGAKERYGVTEFVSVADAPEPNVLVVTADGILGTTGASRRSRSSGVPMERKREHRTTRRRAESAPHPRDNARIPYSGRRALYLGCRASERCGSEPSVRLKMP